ncbi:MAG TPA: HNH endonuclease [Gemmataceae bacterium]|jgi:hypothetical protein|nr:HNH endonuclease [Gemmataceae bacterium]
MTWPTPFAYPSEPHQRKHGPAGYQNYQDYKPWLRDEFTFRCVYCLERELWYPDRAASFSADHIEPQKVAPHRMCDYTNLVYACTRCNSYKRQVRLSDPTTVAFGKHLWIDASGLVRAIEVEGRRSGDGELVIRLLHLNEDPALSERRRQLEILALKREFPTNERVDRLFLQSFAYPPLEDLPDLESLRPPAGNSLAENVQTCYHARRKQSSLADVY